MKDKINHCPRCQGKRIINYDDSIECIDCNLEFEKEDILKAPNPSLVLSIQEKMEIADVLRNDNNDD